MAAAGFTNISVRVKVESKALIDKWMPGLGAGDHVLSAVIRATKPIDADAIVHRGNVAAAVAPVAVESSGSGGCCSSSADPAGPVPATSSNSGC